MSKGMNTDRKFFVSLGATAAALLLVLAFLWITPDMQLRNVRWHPPAAQTTDFMAMLRDTESGHKAAPADAAMLQAMTERPLFMLSRRPAPPAPESGEAVVQDAWNSARVQGSFEGAIAGVILHIDGKDQRLLINDSYQGWTLRAVTPDAIVIEKDGQQRSLNVQKPQGLAVQLTRTPALEVVIGTRKD